MAENQTTNENVSNSVKYATRISNINFHYTASNGMNNMSFDSQFKEIKGQIFYLYVSPLKLHSATIIYLHGVSGSALFRNHLKVRFSPLKSSVLRNFWSKYRRCVVHPLFLSAMPRGVTVANIYVENQLLKLT